MRILALVIAIYTPVMFLIHVSTAKILRAWSEEPDSWISRSFPSRRALRVEGVFWLLALSAWSVWRPLALKVMVVVFSAIHFGIWTSAEFRDRGKGTSVFTESPATKRAIVTFDLVEAVMLVWIGTVAILYLSQSG